MSAIIVAGNEIIPDTLTVTVDGTEITAKDFQKVLLNINQASATASVADGTDLMQKMEIINKNANACDVSFTGEGGATVKNLKQNQSMRLSWTGSYWYVTFGGLLSGVANDGTPFNYTTEVTLDEAPVNTVYSTTEVDTGMTWIDGKPIYRKTYTGTLTTYTALSSTSDPTIVDASFLTSAYTMVNSHCTVELPAQDQIVMVPFTYVAKITVSGTTFCYPMMHVWYDLSGSGLRILAMFQNQTHADNFSGKTYHLTVEYTKTTD